MSGDFPEAEFAIQVDGGAEDGIGLEVDGARAEGYGFRQNVSAEGFADAEALGGGVDGHLDEFIGVVGVVGQGEEGAGADGAVAVEGDDDVAAGVEEVGVGIVEEAAVLGFDGEGAGDPGEVEVAEGGGVVGGVGDEADVGGFAGAAVAA